MYTTRYKLFRAPRNRHLKRFTWIAHDIWNYFLGWQRTRHSLGLPYMSVYEMLREFTVLRNSHPEIFSQWRELDSWAARDIIRRLDMDTNVSLTNSPSVCRSSVHGGNPTRSRWGHQVSHLPILKKVTTVLVSMAIAFGS